MKYKQLGSAVPLALIISSILLMLGLGYAKLTRHTNLPTQKVDEQVRLRYLADGVAQIALLKFQLYPSELIDATMQYNATNKAKEFSPDPDPDSDTPLSFFFGKHAKANEFNFSAKDSFIKNEQTRAFNSGGKASAGDDEITIVLNDCLLLTDDNKNDGTFKGVLNIKTSASYKDINNAYHNAGSHLTLRVEREIIK